MKDVRAIAPHHHAVVRLIFSFGRERSSVSIGHLRNSDKVLTKSSNFSLELIVSKFERELFPNCVHLPWHLRQASITITRQMAQVSVTTSYGSDEE